MSEIISLSGQPLESEQKQAEEKAQALKALQEAEEKQKAEWDAFINEIKATRLADTESSTDLTNRIDSILNVLSAKTIFIERKEQSVRNPQGQMVKSMVPNKTMEVNLLDAIGAQDAKMILIQRLTELAYKL